MSMASRGGYGALKARHGLEAALTLVLAVVAVTLEILHVDSIYGREPFRILLPALCALVAVTLLELSVVLNRLLATAEQLLKLQQEAASSETVRAHLDRISSTGRRAVRRTTP
jgi:hypothetical protein